MLLDPVKLVRSDIVSDYQYLGVLVDIKKDGTIKLPLDKCESADIFPCCKVEVFANKDGLIIRAIDRFCDMCGDNGKMAEVAGKQICTRCKDSIRQAILNEEKEDLKRKSKR